MTRHGLLMIWTSMVYVLESMGERRMADNKPVVYAGR